MQPVFSPSVLAEMIRPDGSSTLSVISGESLPAELAHEVMSIQVIMLKGSTWEDSYLNALFDLFSSNSAWHFQQC